MKQKVEYLSSEYCVLPQFITKENMFDGTQYYSTTEHILGITQNPSSWEKIRVYDYNNSIFKGTISYQFSSFYGSIVTHIQQDGNDYYSCNGLCEPERSTQILDLYKKTKEYCGKDNIGQCDLEQYMFVALQQLNVSNKSRN